MYLYSRGEFQEQWVPGKVIRLPFLAEPKGHHAYQVTKFGDETVKKFFRESARAAASHFLSKHIELGIGILLGIAITTGYTLLAKRFNLPLLPEPSTKLTAPTK